ncbi:hypothetical protein P5G50_07630 [Leifsonia sp. F6_8S_P_1B]|uniref:TadE-like protein n=1 Tax=Leifsonia williamsii TaxID=3035919 RepID=A0ABT8KB97_9MICO|nr:hypothetical protein [Leifsonia williamsii]MDN4614317.1 hypothetical protein [Leifsonia williamsii]
MTAEFAAALPAALLCLVLCLGAVQAVAQQSRLVGEASHQARQLGRGEAVPGPSVDASDRSIRQDVQHEGGMVCVTLTARSEAPGVGALGLAVSARQCAIDEEAEEGGGAG